MVRVLIKKLDPKVTLPSYKTKGASGMDLMAFVKEKIVIKPQTSALIPTGLSIAIPGDTIQFIDGNLYINNNSH